jgi:hypothetical protein
MKMAGRKRALVTWMRFRLPVCFVDHWRVVVPRSCANVVRTTRRPDAGYGGGASVTCGWMKKKQDSSRLLRAILAVLRSPTWLAQNFARRH